MLPRERQRIRDQLILWGYSPRLVMHMQPWTLINHYESEKQKRSIASDTVLASSKTDNVETVEKLDNDYSKYKGTSVPYRLK